MEGINHFLWVCLVLVSIFDPLNFRRHNKKNYYSTELIVKVISGAVGWSIVLVTIIFSMQNKENLIIQYMCMWILILVLVEHISLIIYFIFYNRKNNNNIKDNNRYNTLNIDNNSNNNNYYDSNFNNY